MKKIVGIFAAAAVLATSVFAADLTAGVRLEGDLFNYNGTSESAKALMLKNANHFWQAPLTLTISDDRAGGTFKFTDNESNAFETGKWAIWFKPMDMLKVNLGTIDKSMNVETIDYGGRLINYDSFGASLDVNVDAFSMTFSVVSGNGTYWFQDGKTLKAAAAKKAKEEAEAKAKEEYKSKAEIEEAGKKAEAAVNGAADPDASVGEFNFYAQYSADFGTISAMFDAKNTFKDLAIGAGYKNTFDPLTIFADVAFYKGADDVNGLGVDADVVFAQDALNAQAYVQWKANNLEKIEKGTMDLLALAKVSYTLDAGTVYLYFKDADLMADDFSCTIKPGFTSKVSIMDYEIAVKFDIAKKVDISVPVNFKVNF
ncbi:hypothetical protein [Treponema bryantii]|uniref:hypothetical protein n=1 Tax=Treponema bryantii TaxID=163 RepID=UPI0003B6B789|nr:hypothetical protein [Treponema bryantii]